MDDVYVYAWMERLHIFKPVMMLNGYAYIHVQMEKMLKWGQVSLSIQSLTCCKSTAIFTDKQYIDQIVLFTLHFAGYPLNLHLTIKDHRLVKVVHRGISGTKIM